MGEVYAKWFLKDFDEDSKVKAEEMVGMIRKSFTESFVGDKWLDDETRGKAIEKIGALSVKIGYADYLYSPKVMEMSYGGAEYKEGYFDNNVEASRYSHKYDRHRLKGAVDKREWSMVTSEVNAYYVFICEG
jgi:predicted metalloendopeptidase